MSFRERPRSTWIRRALFQVHLWLGLSVGLIAGLVGLTGALIVFRVELNDWTMPGSETVTPGPTRLSTDEMLARVLAYHPPGHHFVYAYFNGGPEKAWNFRTQSAEGHRWHTCIDPYTGRITGAENYHGKWMQWIYDLHADLLLGKPGRTANGFFAIGLMILSVTGLVVWWPGSKLWRSGFRYERRARWKRQNYDIHKLAGFWSSLMLLVLAVTGAWFSFQDFYMQVLGAPKAPKARTSIMERQIPLDAFIARAEALMPGASAVNISVPQKRGDALSVRLKEAADWHRVGQNYAYFEPATGELLRADRFQDQSTGTKLARLMTPFHFGRFGERFGLGLWPVWITLVLYVVFGLMPPLLLVTGVLMYWNRVLSKKHLLTRVRVRAATSPAR